MTNIFLSKIPEITRNPEITPPEPNPVRDVPPMPIPDKPGKK